MEIETNKKIIESMLFAAGRSVSVEEIALILEMDKTDVITIVESMQADTINRGIEIIKVEDGYQMSTKKEYHEYIQTLFDKRAKATISGPAMETLSIIAYNQNITKPEIEAIRGVSSDGSINKLLEYNIIEEAGRMDAPGRPIMYKTTDEFLRLFEIESLTNLPELPRYKMDENQQIVIEELEEQNNE